MKLTILASSAFLAVISLVAVLTFSNAQTPQGAEVITGQKKEKPLEKAVKEADFAFQGTVTKVEYALSDREPKLPFTYVTFKVNKSLKNDLKQPTVTLRFVGGPNEDGTFTTASGVPLFDNGDTDFLFVKGNGKSGCPLVDCSQGRLRVINNKVFTDEGRKIFSDGAEDITYGDTVPLEEVLTNTIGSVILKSEFSNTTNQDGTLSLSTATAQSVQEATLSPDQLETLTRNKLNRLNSSGQLPNTGPFTVSVDKNERVSTPIYASEAPPKSNGSASPTVTNQNASEPTPAPAPLSTNSKPWK